VMMTKPMEAIPPSISVKTFQYSTTPDFPARSRVYVNQSNEFNWNHPGSPINYFGNIKMEIVFEVNKIEKHNIADIQIFPNPTTGELRIDNGQLTIQSVDIYDVFGRKKSSNHLITTSSNHLIDISHLSAGIYFVRITTETEIVTKKIIKH